MMSINNRPKMVIDSTFWCNKKVLVTGHTGFKGSWLALWLQQLGAEVFGFALAPNSQSSLFVRADVAQDMNSIEGDIRNLQQLKKAVEKIKPDVVFHLAAQALVRYSYQNPLETYETNVMGTLHVLEAIRECDSVRAAVMVTTDKCYENKEWIWPYRENEAIGGHDPYSSSKGCAELLIASYRKSYFFEDHQTSIATARAGNVIGGGDWADDRLIPDIVRAFQNDREVKIRNPNAIRPWQHVLDPLSGYLLLAEKLFADGHQYAEAWNFGPKIEDMATVQRVVELMAEYWGQAKWSVDQAETVHEAHSLKLDSSKALVFLQWQSKWSLLQALEKTTSWYRLALHGEDMKHICEQQIMNYCLISSSNLEKLSKNENN